MSASLETLFQTINKQVGTRHDTVIRAMMTECLQRDQSSLSAKLTALKLARAEAESRIASALAAAEKLKAETAFDQRFLSLTDEVALDMLKAATWPAEGMSYKDPSGVSLKATPTCVCEQTAEDAVDKLPTEYVRVVPETKEADKNRIKAAIKNGERFYGFKNVNGVSFKVNW